MGDIAAFVSSTLVGQIKSARIWQLIRRRSADRGCQPATEAGSTDRNKTKSYCASCSDAKLMVIAGLWQGTDY
jgi:hypothetical protein